MNYEIKDISGNPQYNLKGIKLTNGKTCVYWTNKNVTKVDEVIVILDNRNVIGINNNQICISFHGISDIQTQKELLMAFCDRLKTLGLDVKKIKFKFVVSNKQDRDASYELISSLGLNASVLNFDAIKEDNKEDDKKLEEEKKIEDKIEKQFDNNREITGNSNIYNIDKNGKKIVVDSDRNVAYDVSNNNLSVANMMKSKYEELMNDPVESEKLFAMSDEEVIRYISGLVTSNNKRYDMEHNLGGNTRVGKATVDVASKYDGVSNTELGITQNDSRFTSNKFSSVAEENDNLRVSNPSSSSIGMANDSQNSSSGEDSDVIENNTVEFNEEEEKKEDNVISYYTDIDGKVYDGRTAKVIAGLYCDENNKIVNKDGDILGDNCGSLDDMYANMKESDNKVRPDTMIYKGDFVKNNNETLVKKLEKDNAAFVNLPIIIFIISLLLFIGAGIIWFIAK